MSSCKITWNWNSSGQKWGNRSQGALKRLNPEDRLWPVLCVGLQTLNTSDKCWLGEPWIWENNVVTLPNLKKKKCSGKCRNSSASLTSHLPLLFSPKNVIKYRLLRKTPSRIDCHTTISIRATVTIHRDIEKYAHCAAIKCYCCRPFSFSASSSSLQFQ